MVQKKACGVYIVFNVYKILHIKFRMDLKSIVFLTKTELNELASSLPNRSRVAKKIGEIEATLRENSGPEFQILKISEILVIVSGS